MTQQNGNKCQKRRHRQKFKFTVLRKLDCGTFSLVIGKSIFNKTFDISIGFMNNSKNSYDQSKHY